MSQESETFYNLSQLEEGLKPLKNQCAEDDTDLLQRIKGMYRDIKDHQENQPEIYQPAGEWRKHVNQRMPHYDAFYEDGTDRLGELLGNFWRNELGVLVKQYAGHQQLIESEETRISYAKTFAHDLMIWSNLYGSDFSQLEIPEVGHPWGYLWNGTLIGSKVLRYHALAAQIEGLTADIEKPVVAEIGAGYCGMAHFLIKRSDRFTYIDFDLPETLVVGAYYLSKTLPDRKIYLHEGGPINWEKTIEEYDVILCPNWSIDNLPANSVDVFLNTFSLSEMSFPVIQKYLEKITTSCRHYFLHNNMDREGVVNEGHERTPASQYPLPENQFKLLYKHYDLFQQKHSGRDGDYREFLYQKIG